MFKDGTPELYLRWVQFGVFSPIFRMHSTKKAALDRRPWSKPERIYQAAKDVMQLRHALIPYIYSMAWRAHRTGISLVTPMYYGNMDEASAFDARDQYFFGTELLVAPILKPSNPKTGLAKRTVWLPAGTWFNFFTGEKIAGGRWHEIAATLEEIPVFAKAGAMVPLAPKAGWGGIDNPDELDLYIFPGDENEFLLYEDDGKTTDYLRGKSAITRFTLEKGRFTIHPVEGDQSLVPASRTYRIHLRGVDEKTGATLPARYAHADCTLSLELVVLAPGQKFSVTFTTD
jgi:alpha-glucosidase (family GH31 glycosyl hydrolase)